MIRRWRSISLDILKNGNKSAELTGKAKIILVNVVASTLKTHLTNSLFKFIIRTERKLTTDSTTLNVYAFAAILKLTMFTERISLLLLIKYNLKSLTKNIRNLSRRMKLSI